MTEESKERVRFDVPKDVRGDMEVPNDESSEVKGGTDSLTSLPGDGSEAIFNPKELTVDKKVPWQR